MRDILRRAARASWVAVGLLAASCAQDENPAGPAEPEHPRTVAEVLADVRLSFLLVRGADDYLSIRSITESHFLLGRSASAESSSLSSIKNLYRSVTR